MLELVIYIRVRKGTEDDEILYKGLISDNKNLLHFGLISSLTFSTPWGPLSFFYYSFSLLVCVCVLRVAQRLAVVETEKKLKKKSQKKRSDAHSTQDLTSKE